MSPYRYYDSVSSTSTNGNTLWYNPSSSTSTCNCYQYPIYYREILVSSPECWTDNDTLSFSDLLNKQTHTGFKVTLIIKGEIIITDPNVETRTMENFIPLLRSVANILDLEKIDEFFRHHPIA